MKILGPLFCLSYQYAGCPGFRCPDRIYSALAGGRVGQGLPISGTVAMRSYNQLACEQVKKLMTGFLTSEQRKEYILQWLFGSQTGV